MTSEIRTTSRFRKETKRLSKKYPSLKNDLSRLLETLTNNPSFGISLGKNFFKIRLQIASKGKGKSAGARVITHLDITILKGSDKLSVVYLATIYDKSEMDSVSEKELKLLLKEIQQEF